MREFALDSDSWVNYCINGVDHVFFGRSGGGGERSNYGNNSYRVIAECGLKADSKVGGLKYLKNYTRFSTAYLTRTLYYD